MVPCIFVHLTSKIHKKSVSDPDPHKDMAPGSGSAWTDADPDPGGTKA